MNKRLLITLTLILAILIPVNISFAEQPIILSSPEISQTSAGLGIQPEVPEPKGNRQRIWIGLGGSWPSGTLLDKNVSYSHDSTSLAFQLSAGSNFGIASELGIRNSHFGLRLRSDIFSGADTSFREVTKIGSFTSTYATNIFSYSISDVFAQFMYFIPFGSESDYYFAGGAGLVSKSVSCVNVSSYNWSNLNPSSLKALGIPLSAGIDLALSKHWAINFDATYMLMPTNNSALLVNWPNGTPQNVIDSSTLQIGSYFIPSAMIKYTF